MQANEKVNAVGFNPKGMHANRSTMDPNVYTRAPLIDFRDTKPFPVPTLHFPVKFHSMYVIYVFIFLLICYCHSQIPRDLCASRFATNNGIEMEERVG